MGPTSKVTEDYRPLAASDRETRIQQVAKREIE